MIEGQLKPSETILAHGGKTKALDLEECYFDVDSGGKLVGIDVTNVQEVTGIAAADLNFSGELVGVKEAAALVGKDKANFLRDLASRPDFPKPVARLASGQLWLSEDIKRYMRKREVASKAFNKTAWVKTRPPEE